MSSDLLPLLAHDVHQKIMRFLAESGRANFLEIQEEIPVNAKELRKHIKKLQDNSLVAVVNSIDPDFHTYFLTTEGYRAYRGLHRMLEAA